MIKLNMSNNCIKKIKPQKIVSFSPCLWFFNKKFSSHASLWYQRQNSKKLQNLGKKESNRSENFGLYRSWKQVFIYIIITKEHYTLLLLLQGNKKCVFLCDKKKRFLPELCFANFEKIRIKKILRTLFDMR